MVQEKSTSKALSLFSFLAHKDEERRSQQDSAARERKGVAIEVRDVCLGVGSVEGAIR